MDMDRIKTVIDLMREHELSEFSIEEPDLKLTLKRGGAQPAMMMAAPQMMAPAAAPAPAPAAAAAAAPAPAPEDVLLLREIRDALNKRA